MGTLRSAGSGSLRRIGVFAALVALLVGSLTGCISGNPAGPEDEPEQAAAGDKYAGEIEWWTINLQKNFGPYIQGMIDAYQKEHPDVTIKWVDVPGQDITTKLLAALAGGKVPDAVNFTSATTGLFDDSMSDLTSWFTDEELAGYAPGLVEPLTSVDGRQIAIPWYNGGTSLAFYNTDLLKSVDFDPDDPPQTFDEALELGRQYTEKTGKFATNLMAYSNIVQMHDIPLLSEDRKQAAFNTPETRALLEKFKTYYDDGVIAPGSLSADQRNLPQSLENRQIALSPVTTSSNLTNIENNAPEVYSKIAVAAPVTGPSGSQYMPGQQIFGIPQASDNKAAAAEWLKFVTSPENQLEFCKLVAIYPSTPKTLEDPFFTDIEGDGPAEQARRTLLETFADSVDASLGSENDEQLRLLFDEQVRAYMSGKKPAQQALDDAEKAWNTELTKAK